ncbi:hypothetical protein [Pseudomonas brassicacearum]|uniref:hypothetical protein n=1 Tax=Pseudomonas brassicacearum TaxID=930166 RepID=UPI00069EF3E2|nr:hypothetical protein [Pseudomonas brassicacearum]
MALNLASAVEEVLVWIAYFYKVAEPDFNVDINTEYGVNSSPEELTAFGQCQDDGGSVSGRLFVRAEASLVAQE